MTEEMPISASPLLNIKYGLLCSISLRNSGGGLGDKS